MTALAKVEAAPRERPILFKGEMVRAILEGRKTQTRRVVKPSPGEQAGWLKVEDLHGFVQSGETVNGGWQMWHPKGGPRSPFGWVRCPFGVPGDRLWVRETFAVEEQLGTGAQRVVWRENERQDYRPGFDGLWKPSIFMPRWACRLVLEVTDVRVERVASISEEDAKAEGVDAGGHSISPDKLGVYRGAFAYLWSSINGRESWDANPWVWCVSFRVVTP